MPPSVGRHSICYQVSLQNRRVSKGTVGNRRVVLRRRPYACHCNRDFPTAIPLVLRPSRGRLRCNEKLRPSQRRPPATWTTKLRFLMDARGTDGITNYIFRFGGTRMDPDDTAEMLGLQHGSMIYVGKIVSEGSGSGSSTTPAPLRDGPSCPCSRRLRSRFRPWARP